MVSAQRTQSGEFVLSERRLSGTSAEMFQQLDELIESLLGFRKWLVEEGPRTTATNSASPRRRRANGLASVALAAACLAASTISAYGQAAPGTTAPAAPGTAAQALKKGAVRARPSVVLHAKRSKNQ